MGLEPTDGGTTNHCLNHLATLAIDLSINNHSIYLVIEQGFFQGTDFTNV